jgi:hypothetical protein
MIGFDPEKVDAMLAAARKAMAETQPGDDAAASQRGQR